MKKPSVYPLSAVEHLIKEGDVLLFRGKGITASFIRRSGKGVHTHAGLASWCCENTILEIVEVREWYGGRSVNLKGQLDADGRIDVFRPSSTVEWWQNANEGPPDDKLKILVKGEMPGSETIPLPVIVKKTASYNGRKATNYMRGLTGASYGWGLIWLIVRYKIPLLRRYWPITTDDTWQPGGIFQVCSTAIAEAFCQTFVDLVPNLPNALVEPSDLARSPLLHYLFSIRSDDSKETPAEIKEEAIDIPIEDLDDKKEISQAKKEELEVLKEKEISHDKDEDGPNPAKVLIP